MNFVRVNRVCSLEFVNALPIGVLSKLSHPAIYAFVNDREEIAMTFCVKCFPETKEIMEMEKNLKISIHSWITRLFNCLFCERTKRAFYESFGKHTFPSSETGSHLFSSFIDEVTSAMRKKRKVDNMHTFESSSEIANRHRVPLFSSLLFPSSSFVPSKSLQLVEYASLFSVDTLIFHSRFTVTYDDIQINKFVDFIDANPFLQRSVENVAFVDSNMKGRSSSALEKIVTLFPKLKSLSLMNCSSNSESLLKAFETLAKRNKKSTIPTLSEQTLLFKKLSLPSGNCLKWLNLSDNKLDCRILNVIAKMSSLSLLNLTNCAFKEADIVSFFTLLQPLTATSSLQYLYIGENENSYETIAAALDWLSRKKCIIALDLSMKQKKATSSVSTNTNSIVTKFIDIVLQERTPPINIDYLSIDGLHLHSLFLYGLLPFKITTAPNEHELITELTSSILIYNPQHDVPTFITSFFDSLMNVVGIVELIRLWKEFRHNCLLSPEYPNNVEFVEQITNIVNSHKREICKALICAPDFDILRSELFQIGGISLDQIVLSQSSSIDFHFFEPKQLEHFSFRVNWSIPTVPSLITQLAQFNHLSTLSLCPLNSPHLVLLINMLCVPSCNISTLDISQNIFHDDSLIFKLISRNSSITSLDISYCNIVFKTESFSFDLCENPILYSLNLSGNSITRSRRGLPLFFSLLTNIERLCMQNCFQSTVNFSELFFSALPKTLTVLSIDLRLSFFDFLVHLPLSHLIVFGNSNISFSFLKHLEKYFEEPQFGPKKITFSDITFTAEENSDRKFAIALSQTTLTDCEFVLNSKLGHNTEPLLPQVLPSTFHPALIY